MAVNEVKAILTAEDRNYTSTMNKALNTTEKFGSKLKSGIGFGAFMAIGQKAMSVVGNAVAQNIGGAVKRLDTLNNFPRVMQSLGFSAEEASQGIDTLANGIDHLPTTLDAVASQAQQFVPMTGNIEKATQVTLALNNAMSAGGKDAQAQANAIEQWTKAMAKGKPDFEQWQAMIQTAPAQMDQLAKSMLGAEANQNDLYEAMKSGSVSIDEVNDKMIELTNASEGFDIAGRHYDNFKTQAENASAGIQMSMLNVKASIQRNLANIFDAFDQKINISGTISSIIDPINKMGATISNIFKANTLESGLVNFINLIGVKGKEMIPKGIELVMNFLSGIGASMPRVMQSALIMVGNLILGIVQALPNMIVTGLNAMTKFLEGVSQGNGEVLSKAGQIIVALVTGLIKAMPQIAMAGLQLMVALGNAIWKGITNVASKALSGGKKVWQAVKTGLGTLVGVAGAWISGMWNAMRARLSSAISGARSMARNIWQGIKSGLGNLWSVGSDLIAGLWNGISSRFNSVIASVQAMASRLPQAVKKVLGIGSPSKVMKQIGEWTGEGFAIGIESTYKQVQSAMAGITSLQPAGALGGNLSTSMSDSYDYSVSARYEVVVPLELNGREIARATATEMQSAINQLESRESRKVGIR